jgi:Zn-dependent protease/CBS domain-containing protein
MRAWSGFQIARVRGIPIRLHVTLLLVLPFLAWAFGRVFEQAARAAEVPAEALGSRWVWGLAIAVALFASVLVHELAHSLYALRKGGKVRAITLLMIGGVSEMSEPPRTPGQEAMMAFVGPATSLAIALAAFAAYGLSRPAGAWAVSFAFFYLGTLNVFLAGFNLLPAFPMDGGRVLRGLLSRRIGPVRATRIAAQVGKAFAVLFGVWGVATGSIVLLLVAFFVYTGAEAEARDVLVRAVLGELRVRDLMTPDPGAVAPADPVADVGERMLRDRRLAFPVAEEGRVVGLVTLELIEGVPGAERARTAVGRVMRAPTVLSPGDRVADALRALDREQLQQLAVAEDGRLVGTLSRFEVMRGLQLRELEATLHRGPEPPTSRRASAG